MLLKIAISLALLATTVSAAVVGAKVEVVKSTITQPSTEHMNITEKNHNTVLVEQNGTQIELIRCGTEDPSPEYIKATEELFAAREEEALASGNSSVIAPIRVDVYFHVIAATWSYELRDGWASDIMLLNQLNVLKLAYHPHDIFFDLKGVNRVVNRDWAHGFDELGMKKALRKGTASTLNIYFVPYFAELGLSYLPRVLPMDSDYFFLDGSIVHSATLPGGSFTDYDQGYTTVHEVGHWLGLYHTFQGGNFCAGGGDYVDDTPPEAYANFECPNDGRDTCPGYPGLDPIHNYMDYSWDVCMTHFTPGQRRRMSKFWDTYRSSD